jgi:hypothetical protein
LPYYTWRHEFHIAADGKHLVIADTEWFYTDNVATFLCEGRVLKQHRLTELIPLNLLRLTSLVCRTPPSGESSRFDEQSMTYTLTTNHGETFVFEVTTGELQRHTS